MEKNNKFKFTLNVSKEGYVNKQEALACLSTKGAKAIDKTKIAFKKENVTIDEFLSLAIKGHAFCNIFDFDVNKKYWITNKKGQSYLQYPIYRRGVNKGYMNISFKSDEFFKSSQVIFQDVDFTKFESVEEYINSLQFKPSCVYMSFSDKKIKNEITSRRFHLVYIFQENLDSKKFEEVSKVIMNQIEKDTNEPMDDDCGTRQSQYMNGCFGNSEVYNTNIIYSYNDYKNYIIENNDYKKNSFNNNNINNNNNIYIEKKNEEENNSTTTSTTINHKMEKGEISSDIKFNERLLNDWDRLDEEEFVKQSSDWNNLRKTTPYIYRTEKNEWINGLYQQVDENYFRLFYNINSVVDGKKRRKTLFERMCLRRVIKPSITPEEMVFNTIMDIIRFFDNTDGLLNSDFIKRNVTSCFAITIDDIEDKFSNTIAYLQAKTMPKKGIIYKNKKAHSKDTTFLILDDLYDSELSVQENLSLINEFYGYKIGKSVIYEYLNKRKIKSDRKKLTDEEVINMIDWSLTATKNYEIIKNSNVKLKKDRLYFLYKNNKENFINKNNKNSFINKNKENSFNNNKNNNNNICIEKKNVEERIEEQTTTTTINPKMEKGELFIDFIKEKEKDKIRKGDMKFNYNFNYHIPTI